MGNQSSLVPILVLPYLYLPKGEEKYKTLEGDNVRPVKFESAREAREFIAQYEGVEGFKVHGYERFVYQFISQEFPDEVDYNINQMKIYALDIEVQCENGFPNVEEAAEEMLSITIKDMVTKQYYCWATREFEAEKGVETKFSGQNMKCSQTLSPGGQTIHLIS